MAKKKTLEKPEAEDVFYVGVRDPIEIRRNLLESSREAVQFLQRYEKLRSIRQEKLQAMQQLRIDVRELRALVNNLRKALPKTKLRIRLHEEHQPEFKCDACSNTFKTEAAFGKHMKKHEKKKKEVKKEAKPMPEAPEVEAPKKEERKPRTQSELERLESELTEIEGKLGELS